MAVLAGPSLDCVYANALWARWSGTPPVGRTFRELFAARAPGLLELLDEAARTREPRAMHALPLRFASADEREPQSFLNVYAHPSAEGGASEVLLIALDVTVEERERQRAETRVGELEHEARARDELVGTLIHDLRNPLAGAKMALTLLDPDGAAEVAARYQQEALDRLNELEMSLDGLLDLSRIAAGNLRLREDPFELGLAVAAAIEAVRPRLDPRRLQLDARMSGGPFPLLGDAARVQQAVLHALDRAARRSRAGGRLELRLEPVPGRAASRVIVRDFGPPLTREEREQLFEALPAPGMAHERSGALAVARVVVELHGGTVEALDEGRTLVYQLPLDARSQPERRELAAAPPALPRRRVLVVEDSDEQRAILAVAFEQLGQETHTAESGRDALAQLLADPPALALIDVGLPDMDGYQVARRVRDARGRQPILVALTGYGGARVQELCDEAGFDLCLTKPLSLRALETILRATQILRPRQLGATRAS